MSSPYKSLHDNYVPNKRVRRGLFLASFVFFVDFLPLIKFQLTGYLFLQRMSGTKTLLVATGCLIILGVLLAIALLEEMKNEEKINSAVNHNTSHQPELDFKQSDDATECR